MSQQQSLQVELGDRSYPIHVGDLGVQAPEKLAQLLQPLIPGQQVAVITNETDNDVNMYIDIESKHD